MTTVGTFLKGAMVGAALALLFTPKSGEELRKELMQKKEEAKNKAKDYTDMAKEKGENLHHAAEDASEDIHVTLKENYGEDKEEVGKTPEPQTPMPRATNDDTIVADPEPIPPVELPNGPKVNP